MIRIDPLNSRGSDAVDALLDAAFGTDRRGRTAYKIRRGMAWLTGLSFAAVDMDSEDMVGLLQSWPVALHGDDGAQTPLVMVGPVAVLPKRQSEGLGRMMMDRLIAAATDARADPLVMIGDGEYYGRFWGFTADATGGWQTPGPVDPSRLLARIVQEETMLLPAAGMLGPRATVTRIAKQL